MLPARVRGSGQQLTKPRQLTSGIAGKDIAQLLPKPFNVIGKQIDFRLKEFNPWAIPCFYFQSSAVQLIDNRSRLSIFCDGWYQTFWQYITAIIVFTNQCPSQSVVSISLNAPIMFTFVQSMGISTSITMSIHSHLGMQDTRIRPLDE